MVSCSKCNKKLGFLSIKHKSNDGSIMCHSCFEEWKINEEEKNKMIITNYASKYLSNKSTDFDGYILGLHKNKEVNKLIDKHSLDRVREHFQILLDNVESSNKSGLSGYEIDEIVSTTEMCEKVLDFLDDFEKMYKLLSKKGMKIDYHKILSVFSEVIDKNLDKEYDKIIVPAFKRISKRLGENISKEKIIEEFMKIPIEIDYTPDLISKLLDKFNLDYGQEEIEDLIGKIKEDVDLDEFEQDLGSSQKINLGGFIELSGYEFQEYLKNLFKLLGYVVIQTKLSGDQGADLIISKDGEKIVVQAKKYNGKVSNEAVQEVVAAKNHYKANKAIVVTNSSFTKSAIDLALSNNVELWDGAKLKSIIKNLETKSKRRTLRLEKAFKVKEGKKKPVIKIPCPFCEEEFDYEIDARKNFDITTKCPHCGSSVGVNVKARIWSSTNCGKKFNSKIEAEKHEKICENKK